jgi:hypothetical protein
MRRMQVLGLSMTFVGGALISTAGLAQTPAVPPPPEVVPVDAGTARSGAPDAYGSTAMTVVRIHASAFQSQCAGDALYSYWNTGITYRQSGADAACMLHAPVQLPAGAVVTEVGFDGYDVDPTLNINWGFSYVSQSAADTVGVVNWNTQSTSSGSFSATLPMGAPLTVEPGNYYFALVQLNKIGPDMRIKGMRVGYKLQVSPAPATATFSDVPTGHWAFKYIEALAASGITGGCAPGQYCPNNPITRAEMAVFLADALGLHWGN